MANVGNTLPAGGSYQRAKSLLQRFVAQQTAWSEAFDRLFPPRYRLEGNSEFRQRFVPRFLRPNVTIYDIGGGKHPHFSVADKEQWGVRVVGLDIDAGELARAPHGAYDEAICADITAYRGRGDADLVICRALLEHVPNVEQAFEAIASLLKPGGLALIFVPSRHAVFARLNLLLPQKLKERILYGIYPDARQFQGFPSYYDRCTPKDFRLLAERYGLVVQKERHYYFSYYFQCFFPAFVAWRLWILLFERLAGTQAAETFSVALQKPHEDQSAVR